MEKQLNILLSDFVVEYHKLQNFHWYVKGKDFFQVHAKLEELYDHVNGAIDELAETMLMVDYTPLASLKDFSANATIQEADAKYITSDEVMKEVLSDFKALLKSIKALKHGAEDNNLDVVAILMDDYIKEFTKSIWMMSQVVES
ncbi:MAG: Dps family protein [Breznakia sp.]